jgi:[ribosomal protein S18]-alanine N-acetyltransferase
VNSAVRATDVAGHRIAAYRLAEYRDLNEIARVDAAIFPDLPYPYFVMRQMFELYKRQFLVVEINGAICGYSLVAIDSEHAYGWLLGLGVLPSFRGGGYGKELMERSIGLCGDTDVLGMKITVRPTNQAAYNIYKNFGFVEVDQEDDYFGPGEERHVLMKEFQAANHRRTSSAKNTLVDTVPR